MRQLSSCITEKYNGFPIIATEYSKKIRKKFKPIDIIYKPINSPEKKNLCYYTQDISKAYRNSCGADKISHGFSYECCYCRNFFARPDKHKKHMESCSGVPGIVYNFNNKKLLTFEDNFGAKGDLPMTIYFDYETTAPTDNYFDLE